ncbi:MAG: hypothetical protein H6608_06105 [Flavobacteriales bacterium]|nr:hypothetical protein [Bacteroidota bacterium]MCB9240681.1 hypothetical protein [Flavobacteriales bacterium]
MFRAIDHPQLSEQYVHGHRDVLLTFGIKSVASSNPSWTTNPGSHCLVAIQDGIIYGGIRIDILSQEYPLPLQDGVGHLDPNINIELQKRMKEGIGEQCGLWNSHKIKGFGISWILVNTSIAVLPTLGVAHLYGLASDYSMFLFRPAGFRIQTRFGSNGDFVYPTNDYIARVVTIEDVEQLSDTAENERSFIKTLRTNLNQMMELKVTNVQLSLNFNLKI